MQRLSRDLTLLAGDARTHEFRMLVNWLAKMPSIRRKFIRWSDKLDPLRYNEAASVAALANAASNAGYLALTEYVAFKRHAGRGRPFRKGRCDLWIADVTTERCWAFEFKQHFCSSKVKADTLHVRLQRAVDDARAVDRNEADVRLGSLIIGAREGVDCSREFIDSVDGIAATMPYAFRMDGGCGPAWLAFEVVA